MRGLLLVTASAFVMVLGAPVRAQAPPADPSEVLSLRVTRDQSDLRLDWMPPASSADTYQVRRCTLPSLRAGFYGNCAAEGIVATTWSEPMPSAAAVFYLVSGTRAGVEGSHGRSFDGLLWRERFTPECSSPEVPGPFSVAVRLDEAIEFCGIAFTLRYPQGMVAFTSANCTDLASAFAGQTNDLGDRINQACAWGGLDGPSGPGFVARIDFMRGACPLTVSEFELVTCEIADCDIVQTIPVSCSLW